MTDGFVVVIQVVKSRVKDFGVEYTCHLVDVRHSPPFACGGVRSGVRAIIVGVVAGAAAEHTSHILQF